MWPLPQSLSLSLSLLYRRRGEVDTASSPVVVELTQ
jgi:hypothetical protein